MANEDFARKLGECARAQGEEITGHVGYVTKAGSACPARRSRVPVAHRHPDGGFAPPP